QRYCRLGTGQSLQLLSSLEAGKLRRSKQGGTGGLGGRRHPSSSLPGVSDSSSSTIMSLIRLLAYLAATPKAFLIALSPELPWQIMQMPSIPNKGAPPWLL